MDIPKQITTEMILGLGLVICLNVNLDLKLGVAHLVQILALVLSGTGTMSRSRSGFGTGIGSGSGFKSNVWVLWSLMVRWIIGSIFHGGPIELFHVSTSAP